MTGGGDRASRDRTPWWSSEPEAGHGPGGGAAADEDAGDGAREHGGRQGAGPEGAGQEGAGDGHVHDSVEACQICPICAVLRVVGEARPDLVVHLSEAARHLTLAAKAIVDAHAEGFGKDGGFQRIPLDEE